MPITREFLERLDKIINEAHTVVDELDPDSEESELLFGPINDLGYAVDQLLTIRKAPSHAE